MQSRRKVWTRFGELIVVGAAVSAGSMASAANLPDAVYASLKQATPAVLLAEGEGEGARAPTPAASKPAVVSSEGGEAGEGEGAVRAAIPSALILRPSLVVGPEDQFLNRFAAMARSAPFLPVIAGDTRFQPVFVNDVAAATLAALSGHFVHGHVYELGGPEIFRFRDILAMINTETRRHRRLIEVPAGLARLMGAMGDHLPFLPMTSDQFAMLQNDNIANPALPGLTELGITPTPLAAFVPAMLERYRPGGRFSKAV